MKRSHWRLKWKKSYWYTLAHHFQELKNETGRTLAKKAVLFLNDVQDEDLADIQVMEAPNSENKNWKLGKIHTYSFRGLAPAGEKWSFDFQGNSHLLYGPNGAGKTSLLGAVSWCINGRIFRDDGPPSFPESVSVYSTDDPPRSIGTRPDALSLIDTDGNNTEHEGEYWVALEFISTDEDDAVHTQWVKRHNAQGLMTSEDGINWSPIESSDQIGISEIDTELHILMPARVPYLRFGKESDFLKFYLKSLGLMI